MRVGVLTPWQPGCPHRERAWKFLRPRYPWPVTEARAEPWNKPRAIIDGLLSVDWDIVIVADADVWTDGLPEAVAEVEAGAPWAIPHFIVHRLSEQGTASYIGGEPWEGQPTSERPHRGMPGGGYLVAWREVLLAIPPDPRFADWGQEDECQAMALHYLAGPCWRGKAPLVHLYHPPQQRMNRRMGSIANRRHFERYAQARCDPAAMRALIGEIDLERHPTHQPNLRPAPASVGV